jgi:hypothetical protein
MAEPGGAELGEHTCAVGAPGGSFMGKGFMIRGKWFKVKDLGLRVQR